MKLRTVVALIFAVVVGSLAAAAQTAPQPPAPTPDASQDTPYTLKVFSRAVLTDVTVTDKQGNPVTGLTQQDFRILDNGKPQQLASFDEHREQMSRPEKASATPGVFSNEFLRHPPPEVNALLFDTTTIHIVDQMYLFEEMKHFVDGLPPGEPVAVFTRWGDVTLQLSEFTDDHAVLLAAIGRAIPKLQSTGAWMASEIDTLRQMAVYLNQLPGRKNLIWFTGGSNLFLNLGLYPALSAAANDPERREMYDLLETERIAIYPVDARGLTVELPNPFQQMQMRQDAEATGGQAYMNTNGLALAAQHVVSTDGDFYTLTYSPKDLKNSGKWHSVEVKLNRKGYELSYRRGYFDDGSNQPAPQGKTRTMLMAGAKKFAVSNDRTEPLVFTAQVEPAPPAAPTAPHPELRSGSLPGSVSGPAPASSTPPPRRGQQRYVVRYRIPARDVDSLPSQPSVATEVMGSAVLALDHHGEVVAKRAQKVKLNVDEAKKRALSNAEIEFTQTVDLPKGRDYLYLAVWDTITGRIGTVVAEVEVGKPAATNSQ